MAADGGGGWGGGVGGVLLSQRQKRSSRTEYISRRAAERDQSNAAVLVARQPIREKVTQ